MQPLIRFGLCVLNLVSTIALLPIKNALLVLKYNILYVHQRGINGMILVVLFHIISKNNKNIRSSDASSTVLLLRTRASSIWLLLRINVVYNDNVYDVFRGLISIMSCL
eukprot:360074_1